MLYNTKTFTSYKIVNGMFILDIQEIYCKYYGRKAIYKSEWDEWNICRYWYWCCDCEKATLEIKYKKERDILQERLDSLTRKYKLQGVII